MFSCDISDDGQLAVIGGHGNGIVIDTEKGETLKCIPYGCFVTAFVPGTRDFIVDGLCISFKSTANLSCAVLFIFGKKRRPL